MAESIEISRQSRPIKIKQKGSLSPVNYERNAQHWDDEINKIYQILGSNGVITAQTVTNLVTTGGGGGSTPAPTPVTSSEFWQDPVIDKDLTDPPF